MDLPATSDLASGSSSFTGQQPDASLADNFAEQGLDTMRKRPDSGAPSLVCPTNVMEHHLPASVEPVVIKSDFPCQSTKETGFTASSPVSEPVEKHMIDPVHGSMLPEPKEEPKKVSIAARVAAFESNRSQTTDSPFSRSTPRPPVAPKPRR
jgi:hypothetical protein